MCDEDLENRTPLNVDNIIKGIHLCLSASQFGYNKKLYNQEDGLAMGSPLSPILGWFWEKALASFANRPKVWWRNVNDAFVVIRRDYVNLFLQHLNNLKSEN